ncbi:bcl-2-like protein 1 [Dreissena polymorpha]|uniref:bcl-2-like protein 1 n=1 Tax=Dreissena polymorpha TaxID=45954 RepID=UPI002264DDF5|nr:bcl-2-like protein 1 [Dreissena polymorpha]
MAENDNGLNAATILAYYIEYKANKFGVKSNSGPIRNVHKNNVTDAVVELCEEFENRYEKSIGEMCTEYASNNLTKEGYWSTLSELVDQDLNWGRVIAIFAYAGALAVDRMRSNCHGDVENIQDWTCKFMRKYVEQWIDKNNGWNGLVEFHKKPT